MGLVSLRCFRREILDAAARHGIRNVRVFGSIAHGDDHENSDGDRGSVARTIWNGTTGFGTSQLTGFPRDYIAVQIRA